MFSREIRLGTAIWSGTGLCFVKRLQKTSVQGGAVNRGLKHFFSLYRPSYLIEAYVWTEKYWLMWAGSLTNHPFNFNFIFLSEGTTAVAERAACFADLYRR
jgi:hypothetical protein